MEAPGFSPVTPNRSKTGFSPGPGLPVKPVSFSRVFRSFVSRDRPRSGVFVFVTDADALWSRPIPFWEDLGYFRFIRVPMSLEFATSAVVFLNLAGSHSPRRGPSMERPLAKFFDNKTLHITHLFLSVCGESHKTSRTPAPNL